MELPLSGIMWDLVFGRQKNLHDLKSIDSNLFAIFSELQQMANRKS